MFCNQCGAKNIDGVKFCNSCGAAMPAVVATQQPVQMQPQQQVQQQPVQMSYQQPQAERLSLKQFVELAENAQTGKTINTSAVIICVVAGFQAVRDIGIEVLCLISSKSVIDSYLVSIILMTIAIIMTIAACKGKSKIWSYLSFVIPVLIIIALKSFSWPAIILNSCLSVIPSIVMGVNIGKVNKKYDEYISNAGY